MRNICKQNFKDDLSANVKRNETNENTSNSQTASWQQHQQHQQHQQRQQLQKQRTRHQTRHAIWSLNMKLFSTRKTQTLPQESSSGAAEQFMWLASNTEPPGDCCRFRSVPFRSFPFLSLPFLSVKATMWPAAHNFYAVSDMPELFIYICTHKLYNLFINFTRSLCKVLKHKFPTSWNGDGNGPYWSSTWLLSLAWLMGDCVSGSSSHNSFFARLYESLRVESYENQLSVDQITLYTGIVIAFKIVCFSYVNEISLSHSFFLVRINFCFCLFKYFDKIFE